MPTAIVTGGNSGIGRACAVALARRGFDLGITWHADEEHLESVVTELSGSGARVEARRADFEQHGADAVIDELADALGGLDALVLNAASGHSSAYLETDEDTFRTVLELTLIAPFLCGRRAARRMGSGGRIVHVTSVHEHGTLWGRTGDPFFSDELEVLLAGFFHNTVFWESDIEGAAAYQTFLGASCL